MSLHHTSDDVCPLCEHKLTEAHPYLVDWYRNKVKPKFKDAHISWSYRGEADQEQAYIDHKTKCHYPNSPHNHTEEGKPLSLALDLFQIDENHQALFSPRFYFDINEMNVAESIPLKWGGTFKDLGDADHFQVML